MKINILAHLRIYMAISIDVEKPFDKIQYPFIIKNIPRNKN